MDSFLLSSSSAAPYSRRVVHGRRWRGGVRISRGRAAFNVHQPYHHHPHQQQHHHPQPPYTSSPYFSSSFSSPDPSPNISIPLSSSPFSASNNQSLSVSDGRKKLCRAFLSEEGCDRGDECTSAHDAAEATLCLFAMRGRCRFGDRCMWIHGEICSSCNRLALHPFNKQQRDDHIATCVRSSINQQQSKNEVAMNADGTEKETESKNDPERFECSVCYEPLGDAYNRTAALLSGCDHPFCIQCIQEWRSKRREYQQSKEDVTRGCPICRKISVWILPHFRHLKEGNEKSQTMQRAREAMAKKPCRNYSSKQRCFFGRACFYQHINRDGRCINDPLTDGGKSEFFRNHSNKIPREIRALMPSIFDDISDDEQNENDATRAIRLGRRLQDLLRAMTITATMRSSASSSSSSISYDSDEDRPTEYSLPLMESAESSFPRRSSIWSSDDDDYDD